MFYWKNGIQNAVYQCYASQLSQVKSDRFHYDLYMIDSQIFKVI